MQVVQPDEDCTVKSMLQRHAAVREDIARYDLEHVVVEAVDGRETCRDWIAGNSSYSSSSSNTVCCPQQRPKYQP